MTLTPNATMLLFVPSYGLITVALGIWFSRRIKDNDGLLSKWSRTSQTVLAGILLAIFTGSGTITRGSNSLGHSHGFWDWSRTRL